MAYRSEAGKIGNKQNYKDLNLTRYPNALDTRANNDNMRGFVNVGEEAIPDYVMAEYVNSVSDAVMAIEKSLGVTPMVPVGTAAGAVTSVIESSSVSARIASIESGLLDERYGGAGWSYVAGRPTLSKHEHTGTNGQPGKINLVNEIEGLLQKTNLNITQASGLTGADLFVSKTNNKKIDASLDDMLSKTTGGIVLGQVNLKGGLESRTIIERTAPQFFGNVSATLTSDASTTDSRMMRGTGTGAATIHQEVVGRDLQYGQYIISVRVKTPGAVNANVLTIQGGSTITTFKGNEIGASYTTVYALFNHNNPGDVISIKKVATTTALSVDVDNFSVQPVHPAVFDR